MRALRVHPKFLLHSVGADYISARGTTDDIPVPGRIYNAPLHPGSVMHRACRGRSPIDPCRNQSKNLSWMARMAFSESALSMSTETLISLVEIMWMLIWLL